MQKAFKNLILWLILMCCTIAPNFSMGQEINEAPKNKTYAFSLGYERSLFKDINFSPLNNSGNSVVLDFQYLKQLKNENLFSIAVDLPLGITRPNKLSQFNAIQTIANIEVAYLKKLALNNTKYQLYAGGQYHTYYHLVFYDGTESFTMFGLNGIDASAKLTYDLNEKQKLSTKVSLPLIAQLVRPPYTGWDKFITDNSTNIPKILTRGKITSLNKFFGFNFDLNYAYTYKAKRSVFVNYGMRYYRTNEVKKSIVMNNQINVGINIKI